jgi:hypothetical protein
MPTTPTAGLLTPADEPTTGTTATTVLHNREQWTAAANESWCQQRQQRQQRQRVSPVRHSPPTPGRQGEKKPVNRIGRAETSILFHSNSRHTTNGDTLLQQKIQGHHQMQQQQSYTTVDTIEQQLMMRQDANNNNRNEC